MGVHLQMARFIFSKVTIMLLSRAEAVEHFQWVNGTLMLPHVLALSPVFTSGEASGTSQAMDLAPVLPSLANTLCDIM